MRNFLFVPLIISGLLVSFLQFECDEVGADSYRRYRISKSNCAVYLADRDGGVFIAVIREDSLGLLDQGENLKARDALQGAACLVEAGAEVILLEKGPFVSKIRGLAPNCVGFVHTECLEKF